MRRECNRGATGQPRRSPPSSFSKNHLDHFAWFRQKVTASLGKLDRGEFLTHEEVGARIAKMFPA
jgi:predicted transcriptional regulator